jgi:hypothetical protein
VVVITTIGVDKPLDALLIEFVELVSPLPGGEGEACAPARVGLRNDALVTVLDDLSQLSHKARATFGAVVIDDHVAIRKVVDLEFVGNRLVAHSPSC